LPIQSHEDNHVEHQISIFTYEGYDIEHAKDFGTLKAMNFTVAYLHADTQVRNI
jgi:hypothetical protein